MAFASLQHSYDVPRHACCSVGTGPGCWEGLSAKSPQCPDLSDPRAGGAGLCVLGVSRGTATWQTEPCPSWPAHICLPRPIRCRGFEGSRKSTGSTVLCSLLPPRCGSAMCLARAGAPRARRWGDPSPASGTPSLDQETDACLEKGAKTWPGIAPGSQEIWERAAEERGILAWLGKVEVWKGAPSTPSSLS